MDFKSTDDARWRVDLATTTLQSSTRSTSVRVHDRIADGRGALRAARRRSRTRADRVARCRSWPCRSNPQRATGPSACHARRARLCRLGMHTLGLGPQLRKTVDWAAGRRPAGSERRATQTIRGGLARRREVERKRHTGRRPCARPRRSSGLFSGGASQLAEERTRRLANEERDADLADNVSRLVKHRQSRILKVGAVTSPGEVAERAISPMMPPARPCSESTPGRTTRSSPSCCTRPGWHPH